MKTLKIGGGILVALVVLFVGLTIHAMRGIVNEGTRSMVAAPHSPVPASMHSRNGPAAPAAVRALPASHEMPRTERRRRSALEWQRGLYDPKTTAAVFRQA